MTIPQKEEMLPLSAKEILQSIPGAFGIHLEEHASYEVIESFDDFEIRRYAACMMVHVAVAGTYEEARDLAFVKLFNYLHGKNADGLKMEMTTPVWVSLATGGWKMSFFIPKDFAAMSPAPVDPAVTVESFGERLFAALRFSGNPTEEHILEQQGKLLQKITELTMHRPVMGPFTAQYDQPFAIPLLKRNEAIVEVSDGGL